MIQLPPLQKDMVTTPITVVNSDAWCASPPSVGEIPSYFPTTEGDLCLWGMMAAELGDMQLHCVMTFDGHLDAECLARAVRLIADAEPVVGCRLIPRWWRSVWQRREDLDQLPLCTIVHSEHPIRDLHAFMLEPLDVQSDPLMRVRIFRSDVDIVCIKLHHIIADGGGTKEFAYLLASLYRKLQDHREYQVMPNNTASRNYRQVTRSMGWKSGWRILRRNLGDVWRRIWPMRWYPPPFRGDVSATDLVFVSHTMIQSEVVALREVGRRHNMTLNDLIAAAFMRTLYSLYPPRAGTPLRMMNTVDLRRYLPDNRADGLCNLSGFSYLLIDKELGATILDTAHKVKADMDYLKRHWIGNGDVIAIRLLMRILPNAWSAAFLRRFLGGLTHFLSATLTNLGPISADRLNWGTPHVSDAFVVPPITYPPFFVPGISGYRDSLTFSVGVCQTSIDIISAQQFLTRWGDELRSCLPT